MRSFGMMIFLASALMIGTHAAPGHDLSFGQHYKSAMLSRAAGAGIGLVFGGIGGAASNSFAPVALGFVGGSLIGTAYGANTATPSEEADGSFLLSLAGAVGGDALGSATAYGIGRLIEGERQSWVATSLGLAGWIFLEPLGAVALQRWSSSRAVPAVSLWAPRDADFQPGLLATWSFR